MKCFTAASMDLNSFFKSFFDGYDDDRGNDRYTYWTVSMYQSLSEAYYIDYLLSLTLWAS